MVVLATGVVGLIGNDTLPLTLFGSKQGVGPWEDMESSDIHGLLVLNIECAGR